MEVDGPQQNDGYDCGYFVLSAKEHLTLNFLLNGTFDPAILKNLTLSDLDVVVKRSVLGYIICNRYNISADKLLSLINCTMKTQTPMSKLKKLSLNQASKVEVTDTAVQTEETDPVHIKLSRPNF